MKSITCRPNLWRKNRALSTGSVLSSAKRWSQNVELVSAEFSAVTALLRMAIVDVLQEPPDGEDDGGVIGPAEH